MNFGVPVTSAMRVARGGTWVNVPPSEQKISFGHTRLCSASPPAVPPRPEFLVMGLTSAMSIFVQNGQIRHMGTKRCMELSKDGSELQMLPCSKSERQIWFWKRNKSTESDADDIDNELHADKDEEHHLRPLEPLVKKQKPVAQEIAADDY